MPNLSFVWNVCDELIVSHHRARKISNIHIWVVRFGETMKSIKICNFSAKLIIFLFKKILFPTHYTAFNPENFIYCAALEPGAHKKRSLDLEPTFSGHVEPPCRYLWENLHIHLEKQKQGTASHSNKNASATPLRKASGRKMSLGSPRKRKLYKYSDNIS